MFLVHVGHLYKKCSCFCVLRCHESSQSEQWYWAGKCCLQCCCIEPYFPSLSQRRQTAMLLLCSAYFHATPCQRLFSTGAAICGCGSALRRFLTEHPTICLLNLLTFPGLVGLYAGASGSRMTTHMVFSTSARSRERRGRHIGGDPTLAVSSFVMAI